MADSTLVCGKSTDSSRLLISNTFTVKKETLNDQFHHLKAHVDIGDIFGATGELSVCVNSFAILTKSLLPLPDKYHCVTDVDKRYRQRSDTHIRKTMESLGFIEVETPVLQGAAGRAEARPFVTYHNSLGKDLYLRIATELHLKRMLVRYSFLKCQFHLYI
ncbi:hypothetical protein ACFE04_021325 [Oxalis oulophora]